MKGLNPFCEIKFAIHKYETEREPMINLPYKCVCMRQIVLLFISMIDYPFILYLSDV